MCRPVKMANKYWKGDAQGFTPGPEFNEVQSAFAALTLADERLSNFHALSELDLRETCVSASLCEKVKKNTVFL